MYRSLSPAPPKAQAVGWETRSRTVRSSSPAGVYRRTAPPPQNATHTQPSASTVSPSGEPGTELVSTSGARRTSPLSVKVSTSTRRVGVST